jgi:hypothetical protein
MSRSRVLTALFSALLFALTARPAPAQDGSLLDVIGAVDYARGRSVVQVGAWATYRMTTSDDKGVLNDCTVTVMIAGEEEWWGEECFWVETLTKLNNGSYGSAATLMSTAVFEDSLPQRNFLMYQRKRIAELDENGQAAQQTVRRSRGELKSRVPPDPGLTVLVDTLGTDTLKTAKGDLVCLKVRTESGFSTTGQSADSSQYEETREVRLTQVSPRIPVTSNAHEEIVISVSRRTWLIGHSSESRPLRLVGRTKTVLELVDYGTTGVEAKMVPVAFRRSLAAQRAAPAPGPKAPAPKPSRPSH